MMPKVLLVDDTLYMRQYLRETLSRAGYEIVGEAEDGEKALELYPELKPELVFLDLVMPKKDGVSVLKQLREQDPAARVIAMSDLSQDALIREVMLAGAHDYLVKPFEEYPLLNSAHRALLARPERPQSILEEVLAWFDLGESILRMGIITQKTLYGAKKAVQEGKTLQQALMEVGVDEGDLDSMMEESHRDISLAVILLRARSITPDQLRCALVTLRNSGRRLGFTLIELGFCNPAQIAEFLKQVPPYKKPD